MKSGDLNSFSTREALTFEGQRLSWHSLPKLAILTGSELIKLPRSIRILIENLLRHEDGDIVRKADVIAACQWSAKETSGVEIQFTPARVLLQDFTGVPVVADLAAMRSAMERMGLSPDKINPLQKVDLVIDHSVQIDAFGTPDALAINAKFDFRRNLERYEFLKWGASAFRNFQVVPPATGICHQVNLEFLAQVAMRTTRNSETPASAESWVHPDTLVGTDSHTPMVGGLGVLGWGVGGIEAEAAMLGQPCSMLLPDVIGFELKGKLAPGVTATDLVLTITQILRKKGVVGKFVEFTGAGVAELSIADRATISNMAPEYGATVGYWPVDRKTVAYLELTGRAQQARLTEIYYKAQELWYEPGETAPEFSDVVTLDLSTVEPSLAGPAKPHDRSSLPGVKKSFEKFLAEQKPQVTAPAATAPTGAGLDVKNGSIVIAAITSCTNTSNPSLMIASALVARNALARGLRVPKWVKTSFAPGSKAVTGYLREAGLDKSLDALGFNLVGYGCTTCIGNSGPLPIEVGNAVENDALTVAAVLSGNRNFEARIHPLVRANYLASPPLVVAFALAGRIDIDLQAEALGTDPSGAPVYLRDLWPSPNEIEQLVLKFVTPKQFTASYADVLTGDEHWRALDTPKAASYDWSKASSYIQKPPFLDPEMSNDSGVREKIVSARVLASFGDFITTDHISPAGAISPATPAGQYLLSLGVAHEDFNSYGARRGNHEVMVRGTFANVRLRNLLVTREGGWTKFFPTAQEMPIYDAAMKYREKRIPLVIFAGREYGSGSSRDWAAKGARLLGVRAVIAESFERIHRSNLVGMGVLPLELIGHSASELKIHGDELVTIEGLENLGPKSRLTVKIAREDGSSQSVGAIARIDTPNELRYYDAGGILPYVLKRLSAP
jgi:aconitate hydratase